MTEANILADKVLESLLCKLATGRPESALALRIEGGTKLFVAHIAEATALEKSRSACGQSKRFHFQQGGRLMPQRGPVAQRSFVTGCAEVALGFEDASPSAFEAPSGNRQPGGGMAAARPAAAAPATGQELAQDALPGPAR